MTRHALVAALLSSVVAVDAVRGQCPDGSPPPCRSATAPRRAVVNPPLDTRGWIVVPFDNLSRSPDVEWLRVAAVNLLYLDMSRWRDIRVVDDERVADLIREVPEAARETQALSLNAGLAIAKRAGAANLVMGDVVKLGERTTVTAKVFDVKTGSRLRSLREEATVADSVMPLFGKLARKILNVAPPANANVGALGTQSAGAYQLYVEGLDALNRYDLATARARFDDALKRDSTFALAHYKQSIVIGWQDAGNPSRRTHAELANRLSSTLPQRERALILGQLQQGRGEWSNACETYHRVVRADTSDVEGWYGVGECLFHDPTIEAVGGDTTKLRFRADYGQSIRAFERVLRLDPTYHLAYQHIIDALTSERHPNVCHTNTAAGSCSQYTAFLTRSGDSLIARPIVASDAQRLRLDAEQYVQTSSRRRNLDAAHAVAESWVQASPTEPQARRGLGRVLVLQGSVSEAAAELAQVKTQGTLPEEIRRRLELIEIDYKLGRGLEAIRGYDSARASTTLIPGTPFTIGNVFSSFGLAFGRLTEFDSLILANPSATSTSAFVARFQRYGYRYGIAGIRADSLVAAERELFDRTLPRGPAAATRAIASSLSFALLAPRTRWPAIDTTLGDARLGPAIALSKGDTARLRIAASALDSIAATMASAGVADSGFSLVAAEAHLALRDTASALRSIRFVLDQAVLTSPYFPQNNNGLLTVFFAPRSMLLRADLAAATGQREEARVWYKRFIDVWSTAVPELQPLVERARKALAALNTSS